MLEHLNHVDHCSHVAMVAEIFSAGKETLIAEARFMVEACGRKAECAISVTDRFQRLGLGFLLLKRLVSAAAQAGFSYLSGEAFATNAPMIGLARKVGFTLKSDPQNAYLMRLTKRLDSVAAPMCRDREQRQPRRNVEDAH